LTATDGTAGNMKPGLSLRRQWPGRVWSARSRPSSKSPSSSGLRGDIKEGVSTLSAVVSILGFHFVVAYVEFLKLDWFAGEEDIYSVVDVFADFLTRRGE
jgi:hypothetical protein